MVFYHFTQERMPSVKSKCPEKSNKVNFSGKARKLKFACLLHIARLKKECKHAIVFFFEIVLSCQENRHFRFNLHTQTNFTYNKSIKSFRIPKQSTWSK